MVDDAWPPIEDHIAFLRGCVENGVPGAQVRLNELLDQLKAEDDDADC